MLAAEILGRYGWRTALERGDTHAAPHAWFLLRSLRRGDGRRRLDRRRQRRRRAPTPHDPVETAHDTRRRRRRHAAGARTGPARHVDALPQHGFALRRTARLAAFRCRFAAGAAHRIAPPPQGPTPGLRPADTRALRADAAVRRRTTPAGTRRRGATRPHDAAVGRFPACPRHRSALSGGNHRRSDGRHGRPTRSTGRATSFRSASARTACATGWPCSSIRSNATSTV